VKAKRTSLLEAFLLRIAAARVVILFVFHAVVFAACYAFAYLVRFEFAIPAEYLGTFKSSLPVVLAIELTIGLVFGFYRGWWRYVGIADVVRLVFGLTTSLAILVALWYVGGPLGIEERFFHSPRGVFLTNWAFTLLSLFGARVLIRMGRDRFRPVDALVEAKRVMIIGAGDAGETLAREIEHRPQMGMKVVAFVDDQRAKWGSHIRGIKVCGPIADIPKLADDLQADEAFIAIPSASGKRVREIIHHLSAADLQFKTIPGIDHLMSGKVHVTQLRPVNVEDLLRRKRIDLPGDPARALFRGKRVLITGAGGTIGSELAAQVLAFEPESLALVERSEYALYEVRKRLARDAAWVSAPITSNLVDVCDTEVMDALLAHEQPHIVLHAAAHKHVPLGEENPAEYLRNNTFATRRLAEMCVKRGVRRFVFISTDKAINPSSVMGATKRAAEIVLLDIARESAMTMTIVRFGNVIGSSGSVIPLFVEQIAAGGPVTVTHPEVTRYFIRTSEAISLVLQAATLGDAGRIFMLDMGEPVKIVDLARDLIGLSNHGDEIQITFTGLRPGEKLFEEIHLHGESIHPTIHPQIVVTEAPQPERQFVERWTASALTAKTPDAAVDALRRLVPEFAARQTVEPDDDDSLTPPSLLTRPLRAVDAG
jgi:FlaA1/EpsC-like NDP-sugar epimerase